IVQRFQDRFGPTVLCFHSGLGDAAREQAWLRARAGEARVLIGTRSAVFLPFARLGLIVVDEEHDVSYKQQEGLRYSARDVALYRASRNGIAIVLGSATPALETLHNARSGRYAQVRLTRRVSEAAPPRVQILDVRGLPLQQGLSAPLLQAVGRHLQAGGQALLFLNRRGYAPVLLCHDCGWSAPCTQCDAHLTLHRGRARLICHHCGAQAPVPAVCPSCSGRALHPVGQGTERIEEVLRRHFPGERVERLDSDRARRGQELKGLFDEVHAGRVRLLVGTQMLAKGHDFAGLSLVGIVSADQALYGSDFRAIERMGALVTQVAGRAGRAQIPGEVWLQTHEPEHPLLQTLLSQGYEALCDALLAERRETGLPPFAHLALLRAEAREPDRALAFLRHAQAAFPSTPGVTVYQPIPSGMERRAGYVRAQLLLSCTSRARLHAPLAQWVRGLDALPGARTVRWSLDVDPYDLF
ncbi:MAG: primosomal protein N', partial [Gammaproteobacteria bacterium]